MVSAELPTHVGFLRRTAARLRELSDEIKKTADQLDAEADKLERPAEGRISQIRRPRPDPAYLACQPSAD